MIKQLNVTHTIAADTEQTWASISQIGGLDRWFNVISNCSVIGDGVGATRILTLADGAKMQDRIDAIDHLNKRFCYTRTESPFPVQSYQGTVIVRNAGEALTEVSWTVEIDVEEEQYGPLAEFISNALSGGIKGLERELQNA